MNSKFNLKMDTTRAFFFQNQGTFLHFQKRVGEAKYGYIVDAGYISFNCFYFITAISTFDSASCVFWDDKYTRFFLSNQVTKCLTLKMSKS